jgi:tRNA 2-selenouridine synthase
MGYVPAMRFKLDTLTALADLRFDTLIDVRAPSEFADDHVPGAINLPVLNDTERAEIGTLYKQISPFTARKRGAALVARNAAHHLDTALADKPGGWQPLVYCWRGGQRSGSFATILEQVGWRTYVLDGGYKTYRRLVVQTMYDTALPHRFIALAGNTGTAKTDILERLPTHDIQTLDLERLANHRGSVLGAMPGGQPSQKTFESRLAIALSGLDPARPVVVEAESSKIGAVQLPPAVWNALCAAPRITVQATPDDRASYLARTYRALGEDTKTLIPLLERLTTLVGHDTVRLWSDQARSGALQPLALGLITKHYDLRYAKNQFSAPELHRLDISLSDTGLDTAAARIAALVPAT